MTNEGLCGYCKPLFQGNVTYNEKIDHAQELIGKRPHHESVRALRDCGEKRCLLCAVIWLQVYDDDADKWLAQDSQFNEGQGSQLFCTVHIVRAHQHLDISVFNLESRNHPTVRLRLYHAAESVVSRVRKPAGCCESTADATMRHVPQWLEACHPHPHCREGREASWVPSRLLQVCGSSDIVHLRESPPPGSKYMSLSHCWGSRPTLKLTAASLVTLARGIPLDDLPKTYLEAALVARELGVEYLWIDSLCIIQDSVEDWQKEAGQMSKVYQNTYCNIAALDARDSYGGLFAKRDPAIIEPFLVQSNWENGPRFLWLAKFRAKILDLQEDIASAPVHQRAWVLQERMLAPRTLHYGKHMIYWECRESFASENTAPVSSSNLWYNVGLVAVPNRPDVTVASILDKWAAIVERYNGCDMTFMSDRLVAISGLAKETHKALGYCEPRPDGNYLAGLWRCHLEEQLLWHVSPLADSLKPRPIEYRAPTWSWASIDSRVVPYWGSDTQNLLIQVRSATVTTPINDPFVKVSYVEVQIDGLLWRLANSSTSTSTDGAQMKPTFSWDTSDSSLPANQTDLYLLPIKMELHGGLPDPSLTPKGFEWSGLLLGLVLQTSGPDHFQRVGRFHIGVDNNTSLVSELENFDGIATRCVEGLGNVLLENDSISSRAAGSSDLLADQQKAIWDCHSIVLV